MNTYGLNLRQRTFVLSGRKRNIKLKKEGVFFAFLFATFVNIDLLTLLLGKMNIVVQFSCFMIMFLALTASGNLKANTYQVFYLMYAVTVLISSFVNRTFEPERIYYFAKIYIIIKTVQVFRRQSMLGMQYLFSFLICANFISSFYFNEVGRYYSDVFREQYAGIMGGSNAFSVLIGMGLMAAYIRYEKDRGQIRWLFWISVVTCMMAKSATGKTVALMILILYILHNRLNMDYHQWLFLILIGYVILIFFSQIIFQLPVFFNYFVFLNKSKDLSNRIYIWESVFSMLKDHWLIGNGIDRTIHTWYNGYDREYGTAHNTLLQIVNDAGILGTLFYSGSLICVVKRGVKFTERHKLLFLAVITILLGGLTEARAYTMVFWMGLALLNSDSEVNNKICEGV